jgi:hypothetical protein
MRRNYIFGVLLVGAAILFGISKMNRDWQVVTRDFLKDDKPYGPGDFAIRGDQVISLKIAGPVITFKPASEAHNPDVAEPTEPWMNNSGQRLSRTTVNFIRGSIGGKVSRTFSERGQTAAWWHSRDWQTVYISAAWIDYTRRAPREGATQQDTKLWRSDDGGTTWKQLPWHVDIDIEQLRFLDARRGYAIGRAPIVWRTADGGQSWQMLDVPKPAHQTQPDKGFDAADLAANGDLRVAYRTTGSASDQGLSSSIVYKLPWSAESFETEAVLQDQAIVSLRSTRESDAAYGVYALTTASPASGSLASGHANLRQMTLSGWRADRPSKIDRIHTFEDGFSAEGLDVGSRGVVVAYAIDAASSGQSRDFCFVSTDSGRSWKKFDDGFNQGAYFDAETNEQYIVSAYTLKKRKL